MLKTRVHGQDERKWKLGMNKTFLKVCSSYLLLNNRSSDLGLL
jgi:hypothetical protein